MPELPEVEVTRLSLQGRLQGATIEAVRLGKPLRWPLGCEPASLVGRRVEMLTRRGKYLWLALGARAVDEDARREGLPNADAPGGLLLHLGMSGSLGLRDAPAPPGPWDHFDLQTDRGLLRLSDPRRFGAVVWSSAPHEGAAGRLLAGLGVEPFDAAFTGTLLHGRLRGRKVAVKTALLAGDVVVGVGNIYASEALFLAGIDPRTRAARLGLARCERLAAAVREVLARAVQAGGSTLRDFRDAHGAAGAFQLEAAVYGRAGLPCRGFGTPVRRIVQGQRSTYLCPGCQRR